MCGLGFGVVMAWGLLLTGTKSKARSGVWGDAWLGVCC